MNTIKLDGRLTSSLNWKYARKQAQKLADQKKQILWEIDLGLFNNLPNPIDDQSQFLSLTLSLEHFRDGLWNEFKDKTKGLCLYQGSADFSQKFKWDKTQWQNFVETISQHYKTPEAFTTDTQITIQTFDDLTLEILGSSESGRLLMSLFCRDTCVEYIQLLANRLPDGLHAFVILDASNIESSVKEALLTSRDRFEHLHTIIINGTLPHENNFASLAVCLPAKESRNFHYNQSLNSILKDLLFKKKPFRLIPEHLLNLEWEGLDTVIAEQNGLTPAGWRQVQGFLAAGGGVLDFEEAVRLA